MTTIIVPKENRPSLTKYVILTIVGILFVSIFIISMTYKYEQLALGGYFITGIINITIIFKMMESLLKEWFEAAELIEE
ncbi:hypothetical protein [Natronorubrum aibiense]|uniref:Uncharacterized protein n=1 Tax=Natronorubrum aibiense TaxID=348826 RepID=A0A5P9P5G6_9EURY|nr:hypothetical protein [Natronorubrum aibiense]QFU83373.1 hypothetical protein GCU68_12905 [Natronorubrum aibiense]